MVKIYILNNYQTTVIVIIIKVLATPKEIFIGNVRYFYKQFFKNSAMVHSVLKKKVALPHLRPWRVHFKWAVKKRSR